MGYIGSRMSKRAWEAYESGLLPRSKINNKNLRKHSIQLPLPFVKWLIREGHLTHTEWHHTGRDYKVTYFYDMERLRADLDELDLKLLVIKYERGVVDSYPADAYEWEGESKNEII